MEADGSLSGEELVAAFVRWAAAERAGAAARGRARERSLREQAASSATWSGVLVDLAEAGAEVTLLAGTTRTGGRVVGAGADFVVLDRRPAPPALVATAAVSALWPGETGGLARSPAAPAGDRLPAVGLGLLEAFSAMAAERQAVVVVTGDGTRVHGRVVAAAEDFVSLGEASAAHRLAYVPLRSVALCELR